MEEDVIGRSPGMNEGRHKCLEVLVGIHEGKRPI